MEVDSVRACSQSVTLDDGQENDDDKEKERDIK